MSTNCAAASLALPEKNSTAPPRLGGWKTRLVEEGEPGVPVLAGSGAELRGGPDGQGLFQSGEYAERGGVGRVRLSLRTR